MTDALVRQDLDTMACPNPQCDGDHPLVLYARCHPDVDLAVCYDRNCGVLFLSCSECSKPVARVKVATAVVQ